MTHETVDVNGCTKKLSFKFENLDLTNEISIELKKKRTESNLKGFRKGKAPIEMVQKLYGAEVESDALNSFIQNKLYDAINEQEFRVVGHPSFENMKYESGKSVSFDAVIEIFPEVTLKKMSGYKFSKEVVTIDDNEIEKVKKTYLDPKSELVELTDESVELSKGHFAIMNFAGEKEDGERPDNMKGEEFVLEIGSGQFIPGFEEGMFGMKKGEKRDLDLTFPDSYGAKELQNAKIKFEVELLEIKEKNMPELTDELAKEFGYDSVEDFMTKNRTRLEEQKERQSLEKLNQAMLEKLVTDNEFDVPKAMVDQQENYLREDMKQTLQQQGFNEQMVEEYFKKWEDDLKTKAVFQVRSGLILDHLSKKYEIEASEADFEAKLEETAKGANIDVEQVKKYYNDAKVKNNLMYAIREEKTFTKLAEELGVN